MTHLDSIRLRLSHERARQDGSELRAVWLTQIEREEAAELKFLGITEEPDDQRSDDELLAALA